MPTFIKFLANVLSNQSLGVPVFLSKLSVLTWSALGVDEIDINGDFSQIDPNAIDGYRYNPNDGNWYQSPPQPDYGQYGWFEPADKEKKKFLDFLREGAMAWRSNDPQELDAFARKYNPSLVPIDLNVDVWSNDQTITDLQNQYESAKAPERIAGTWNSGSPLILDLDGDGIETLDTDAGIHFDQDGNRFAETSGWVGKDDGLLVWDKNANGKIDSGAELFGNNTVLSTGSKADNGFTALADLDNNRDGKLDVQDNAFANLRVWKDSNSDGLVQSGELLALDTAGVQSLNTQFSTSRLARRYSLKTQVQIQLIPKNNLGINFSNV